MQTPINPINRKIADITANLRSTGGRASNGSVKNFQKCLSVCVKIREIDFNI